MQGKKIFQNLMMVLVSVAVVCLLLEFVVFRFLLVASDWPALAYEHAVLKYQPRQQGVYRVRDEIAGRYRINENGWNSSHLRYEADRAGDAFRIAVVGDSYVEAFQVDYDENLAAHLERRLSGQRPVEVYCFGISGAPLSQYLQMLRKEVQAFQPDVVAVVLIHNDFAESYQATPGVYTKSFLKIQVPEDGPCLEVPPVPYDPPWYAFIRQSASWRYLRFRRQLSFGLLKHLVLRQETKRADYEANIDVGAIERRMAANGKVTAYVFAQMKRICMKNGSRLLLVMDGDRNAVYRSAAGQESDPSRALLLNRMAGDTAQRYGIDFIDLHGVFKADYRRHGRRFNFASDGHWNGYGHRIAAGAVAKYIQSLPQFEAGPAGASTPAPNTTNG